MAGRAKMFRKGAPVPDVAAVGRALEEGRWLYWHDRPKHPSIIVSMQFRTVLGALRMGLIHYAERNDTP